jgi:transcriptional regulator with XRE-family HTH domain
MNNLGSYIRLIRKSQGLTVKQLIELMGKKVSTAYICKIEIYNELPSFSTARLIANALGIDEEYLLKSLRDEKMDRQRKRYERRYEFKVK